MPEPADDRFAITDLLHEYASRIDAGDLEGMAALFEHATYRTEGVAQVLEGSGAVLAAQRHVVRLYDGVPRTHHNITNVRVWVDPGAGTARSESYFTVLFAPPGSGPRPILTGRYHDAFERVDGRWRFADRLIHLDHVGDLSEHLHLDRLDLGGI
jgi:3-phenylpropionate/cinnamic acid dioxygenase small subunit